MRTSVSSSVKAMLQEAMCEGTIWKVDQVSTDAEGSICAILRVSEQSVAELGCGGPTAIIDNLAIRAFKREAEITHLQRKIQLLEAKLEGVLLANGVTPAPMPGVQR